MDNTKHIAKVGSFAEQKKHFIKKISKLEEVPKTKFILLIVANTIDPTIGKGCEEDINSVRHIFEKMSEDMEFNFIEVIVHGEDYGKENILGAIDMLTPGPNDIVVFYYSGHGFSYEKDAENKYPQVDLRSHPASDKIDVVDANTENLEKLFELVKGRGARLNIVIGDCCNSIIDFKRKFMRGDVPVQSEKIEPVIINKKMCEALFCDYTASILVAAAAKGEYAVSDDALGSIFTHNFSKNLKRLLKKEVDKGEGLPWGKLLEETKDKTLDLSKTYDIGGGVAGNQKAIYVIESKESVY